MKKMLVLAFILISSLSLAIDSKEQTKVSEAAKIEKGLNENFKEFDADYIVTTEKGIVNVTVKFKNEFKGDFKEFSKKIETAVKKETQLVEDVVVKQAEKNPTK
ncbi:hypothetical protein [uncultured Cetobacterium sp.]|uniref:hypothetical protein n=1 Tax=uncultured Cetobacterium sp. TaxID=527638 RepID=UPI00260A51B4|nr:hypothetical protein [uncultured Cetobacterium sp.]